VYHESGRKFVIRWYLVSSVGLGARRVQGEQSWILDHRGFGDLWAA